MTEEELRLECLKLALQNASASGLPLEASPLISRARAYADFVLNWRDHSGIENANGAAMPNMVLENGLRRRSPTVPQLNSNADIAGPRGAR
jgi:hypothetical protein